MAEARTRRLRERNRKKFAKLRASAVQSTSKNNERGGKFTKSRQLWKKAKTKIIPVVRLMQRGHNPVESLTGYRTTKKGDLQFAIKPTIALSQFCNFGYKPWGSNAKPVFSYNDADFPILKKFDVGDGFDPWTEVNGKLQDKIFREMRAKAPSVEFLSPSGEPAWDFSDAHHIKVKAPQGGLKLNRELKDAANTYDDKPLVFVIVTGGTSEHAIMCIVHRSVPYTIGFGYASVVPTQKTDQKFYNKIKTNAKILADYIKDLPSTNPIQKMVKWHAEASKSSVSSVLDAAPESIAHIVETVPGILMTADEMLPNLKQSAKLAYVCYLTPSICNSIEKDLKNVSDVIFDLAWDDAAPGNGEYIGNTCSLVLNIPYMASAHWLTTDTRKKMNCIKWVQEKIGVTLNCGWLNRPASCKSITNKEWYTLMYPNIRELENGDIRVSGTDRQGNVVSSKRVVEALGEGGEGMKFHPKVLAKIQNRLSENMFSGARIARTGMRQAIKHPVAATGCVGAACVGAAVALTAAGLPTPIAPIVAGGS